MNELPLTSRILQKLLAFFFKHLYHDFSWAYDLVADLVSLGRWKKWVLEILPHLQGSHVLELGFGPGHLQVALQNAGFITFGVDESIQMGRRAVGRLSRSGMKETQRVVRARAETVPYAAGCFDSVVATFPTPYIFLPETIAEIVRVLKNEGRLVILLAARPTGQNLADRFISWLFAITGESLPDHISLPGLVEPFTKAGLTADASWMQGDSSKLLIITAIKK